MSTEERRSGKGLKREESDPERKEERTEAWGVAFCCHTSGPSNNDGMSSCLILVNDDGSVNLSTGSADIGQGCETTFSQIVAEELGIDLGAVTVTAADTLHVPYDTGTFASGQIYVGGNAVRQAAQEIKERIRASPGGPLQHGFRTGPLREGPIQDHPRERGARFLSPFARPLPRSALARKGTTIIGRSSFKAVESPLPFAVCWAKVAVDKAAKTVEVRHIIEAVDVGTAINPEIVKGQVEGGIGMGLGFAIMEQIEFDKRAEKPSSSDLLHYKIPTALDMPHIHVYIAKGSYEPTGPFGAKSVGELACRPGCCSHCECRLEGHRRADQCPALDARTLSSRRPQQAPEGRRGERVLPDDKRLILSTRPPSLSIRQSMP